MKKIFRLAVILVVCFTVLPMHAPTAAAWSGACFAGSTLPYDLHRNMTEDALVRLGWLPATIDDISEWAGLVDCYENREDAITAAIENLNFARLFYSTGNDLWKIELGYAIHYIEDAVCPPHVLNWQQGYIPYFKAHTDFEVYTAYNYNGMFKSYVTGAVTQSVGSPEDLSDQLLLAQGIVRNMPCMYWDNSDPPEYMINPTPFPGFDCANGASPHSGAMDDWEMCDSDIGECLRMAASLVQGAALYTISPTITSKLEIVEPAPYHVGQTVTFQFTITNQATQPITLDVLTAGGRDPDGAVADATWRANIELGQNQPYSYQGSLQLTKPGTYHMFCAYRLPGGVWNTEIPTAIGVNNALDFAVLAGSGIETNWPAGRANEPRNPWDGFMGFEQGTDRAVVRSTIPGLEFTTTMGLDWIYADKSTGNYNIYPYGTRSYEANGNFCVWLGETGDQGRIDFPLGTATYLSCLVSTYSGVTIDAYDAQGNFLATSGWASSNINTRTFTRLTVEVPGMAYVIIHDTGNYWEIDDICTDAPGVPSGHYEVAGLAREVVGAPYLGDGATWGGKGWDCQGGEFVDPDVIETTGYCFYDGRIGDCSAAAATGLDCSGLVFWAFNKGYDATRYQDTSNPVYYEGANGQYLHDFTINVDESELLPGDVLFFDSNSDGYMDHVAMYVGPDAQGYDVVHASYASGQVVLAKKDDLKNWPSFVGFRRLAEPVVGIEFRTGSPIDLVVTDPDGFTINKDIHEIPGVFYYSEWDIDGDGQLDDLVAAPELKTGQYQIMVVPKLGASSTDSYSLEVVSGTRTIVLADNVPINSIPDQPYIIESNGNEIDLVSNQPPVADAGGPYIGAKETLIAFDSSGSYDPDGTILSYSWDFGDGSSGNGASANHSYTAAGLYNAVLTVTDDAGAQSTDGVLVVVYDPSAGFVTGGGWIDSPSGAYTPEDNTDPDLTGKATFGFVSKYKKGATTPTGVTEFQFKVADLNFHSESYDWLVIAGSKAKYKGVGTINGEGIYGFMLSAIDAGLTPQKDDVDTFRIKIWDKDNGDTVVYDNQLGAAEDANPSTAIAGGSIVIHK